MSIRFAAIFALAFAAGCGSGEPPPAPPALPEVPSSAADAKPIEAGNSVPDVTVYTAKGEAVSLRETLSAGPSVLIVYRGGWCPYCTAHLGALAQVHPKLAAMGFSVFAVSPDKPAKLDGLSEKKQYGYVLLSDSSADAIRALGLAFRLDAATLEKYEGYGIDLEDASGQSHNILPVPAVILIAGGVVRYVHADPDYTKRLDPGKIVEAAKKAIAR